MVFVSFDVVVYVMVGGFDVVGSEGGVGVVVDDFVVREESYGVVVFGKGINGGEDVLEVDGVVWGVRVVMVDRV